MNAFIRIAALLMCALVPFSGSAYPTKPIRVIIPFGPGGPSDFVARTFADRLRVTLNSPVLVDSRPGGNIQIAFDAPLAPLPHLSAGKLRVLGTTGRNRLPQLPNVPTFMEQGVPNYDLELRWGILGPKGIPRDVASRLHAETARIAAMPDVKEALSKLALEPASCPSLQACAAQLKAESELVGGIIRAVGIQPE